MPAQLLILVLLPHLLALLLLTLPPPLLQLLWVLPFGGLVMLDSEDGFTPCGCFQRFVHTCLVSNSSLLLLLLLLSRRGWQYHLPPLPQFRKRLRRHYRTVEVTKAVTHARGNTPRRCRIAARIGRIERA